MKFLKSLSRGEKKLPTVLVTVAPDGQAVVIRSQSVPPSTGDRKFFFFFQSVTLSFIEVAIGYRHNFSIK